jgi:DNA ligase (NAD+)
MISLDNTYNEEELRDFDGRVKKLIKKTQDQDILIQEYTIEFKFDGL